MADKPMKKAAKICIAATVCLGAHAALAQSRPDAGALLEQIERERGLSLPKRVEPAPVPLPREMPEIPGLKVTTKEFRFAGNTIFPSAELAELLKDFVGKELGFADLQKAADTIAQHYRAQDWVVRTYLPRQDITQGTITIQVVESVFGGPRLEGKPPTLVSIEEITARITRHQPIGELMRNERIDRGLLLADDLPGVAVTGALEAGERDGETRLAIQTTDEPATDIQLGADNSGSRSTGPERVNASITLASPTGFADQLNASLAHTEGTNYARLAYSLPAGLDGLRVSLTTSYLKYKIVSSDFAGRDIRGESQTYGLELNYPLHRSRLTNIYLQGSTDKKKFDNLFDGATSTNYDIDSQTFGLVGNLFDNIGGGGANSFSLLWTRGDPSIKVGQASTPTEEFRKLRYSASRQQVLNESLSLFLSVSGQRSGQTLDSSEKFSLGGSSGVRAYPTGEASGSKAQLAITEVRWKLPSDVVLTAFYDWGRIKNEQDPTAPDFKVKLKGGGLSVNWQIPKGPNLKVTLARRDGDNPNPNRTTGTDQDGSLKKNRFWFNLSYGF